MLQNIENVVRGEMDRIGGQELQFSVLLPREPYEAANCQEEFGSNLSKLQDRKGGDYLLDPIHGEVFAMIVRDLSSSYKDLSILLYQVKEKYRNEARPRVGVTRGCEFMIKDLYSFDLTDEGLAHPRVLDQGAYRRVYTRLGLEFTICQAQSGAAGGSASKGFLFPCDTGEDVFVRSPGGYAASTGAVTTVVLEALSFDDAPAPGVLPTPDSAIIESLVAKANEPYSRKDRPQQAGDTLENMVVVAEEPDGHSKVIVVGVPGNHEVDMKYLEAALAPAEVRIAEPRDVKVFLQLVPGYISPQVIGSNSLLHSADPDRVMSGSLKYLLSPWVVPGIWWITGANEAGKHVSNLVAGRNSEADGTVEAAEVLPGDPTPGGSGPLTLARGIETGHTFVLGCKCAEALGLTVLGESGKAQAVTMGPYGIGVSRLVTTTTENTHDDRGLVWSVNVAPFQVHMLATGKDPQVSTTTEKLARELEAAGIPVLYDDRARASAGVKFKDARLIRMPYLLVVGKGLVNGTVETRDRRARNTLSCAVEATIEKLLGFTKRELEKTVLEKTLTELIGEPSQFELDQENDGAVQTGNS